MTTVPLEFFASVPSRELTPIPDYCQPQAATAARRFHSGLVGYQVTPLHDLPGLARLAGVGKLLLKDEGQRFQLQAFKVLGAAYAVARLLAQHYGLPPAQLDFQMLATALRSQEQLTLVTATDGNHGRAVAWAAQQLGQRAMVYLPAAAAPSRVAAITAHGAEAVVTDLNYDDAVRLAARQAEEQGWLLLQDTAWTGYEEVPAWIMQGYTTLAAEAWEQMQAMRLQPTHVFLQAGVGSLAGSQVGYWQTQRQLERPPRFVIMEPSSAACFCLSAKNGAEEPQAVTGDLQTIMAGLSCGEPNPLAWPILRDYATAFVSCPDYVAAYGMRVLGNPAGDGQPVIAGESGAVGAGLVALLAEPQYATWRQRLGLKQDSVLLLINTEGATDPTNYQNIVWRGHHPLP